jgi:Protein of unknown function (DUF1688)
VNSSRTEQDGAKEVDYLKTTVAIRERTRAVFDWVAAGSSPHFALDLAPLAGVARQVTELANEQYGTFAQVPFHSRWRHLEVDGGGRAQKLAEKLAGYSPDDRLRSEFDLVITSVLLDAGAGADWKYRADNHLWSRSEGLAVASFDAFLAGAFSSRADEPCAAHASRLEGFEQADLERAFQVSASNPLLGVAGRTTLLRRLGEVARTRPDWFPGDEPRPGNLGPLLRGGAGSSVSALTVFSAVLAALTPIWPSRQSLNGQALGDVWQHPVIGWVPFHKLSQWLSYSLCETLMRAGSVLSDVEQLTGLSEYRNGGLFIDLGVIIPRHQSVFQHEHTVDSQVVVEWRALTVALLDLTADLVRKQTALSPQQLPLARVLEGGTWALGRKVASARRAGGVPPLRIVSDGTVF